MIARLLPVGVGLTLVIVASSSVAPAAERTDFEVVTSKAVYQSTDGIQIDTKAAFVISRDSLKNIPWSGVGLGLAIGGLALPLYLPEAAVAAAAIKGAQIAVDAADTFEEIINREVQKDTAAAQGTYRFVDAHGRVIPSGGTAPDWVPLSGLLNHQLAVYLRRHLRDPSSPNILQGFLLKLVTAGAIEHWAAPRVSFAQDVRSTLTGQLAETTADLVGRDAGSSGNAGGGGCSFQWSPVGSFTPAPDPGCRGPLESSITVGAVAPFPAAAAAAAEAVTLQVSAAAPAEWFAAGVEVTPVSDTQVTVTQSTRSTESSQSTGPMPERSFKHGPTRIELTGDFGGFRLQ